MFRCVKRRPNRNTVGAPNGLGERNCSTLPRNGTYAEDTDEIGCQTPNSANRPSRWSLSKKSATLSTTVPSNTQTQSESRSSSKSKGFNVFRASNWRTLSLSSLFSPSRRRKRTESETAGSSGFVSPTVDTEPVTGTSSLDRTGRTRRPESIELRGFRHSKQSRTESEASTPTGTEAKLTKSSVQEEQLLQLSRSACADLSDASDHTPTETTRHSPVPFVDTNGTGSVIEFGKRDKSRKLHWLASTNKSAGLAEEQSAKPEVRLKKAHLTERHSDATQSFLRAARAGNLTKVIELLNSGVNIDSTNPNDLTALHLASKEAHLDVVRELLKRGASLQMVTKKGNTALHIASLAGHIDVVKLLIAHGADVNAQSQNGFTPLYMAAQENHVEVVNHLLNNGANPALSTEDGFTPLAVALQQGHDRVVAILLEKDSKGKTRLPALHVAAKKNDVHSATLLLNNSDVNVDHASASGFTPLHIAAHYGNLNIAKLLIERGANVNYLAKNSITPLHVASKWGKNEVVSELLKAGAEVDARTRDGLTPLHCAARSGHADVVETLLKSGANAGLKTRNDLSPLHMTAQGDHEQAARLLLLTGANPDAVTVDYLTPLHVAAHCGNVNVARTLLESNCNVNARALNGFTALHIASKKAKLPLVELLLKNGALLEAATETGLTPLHVASFVGSTDAVSMLLQHGANVNQTTLRNETPLHLVARNKQLETARVLLDHGAQLEAKTRDNQTPLHVAIRSRSLPMVKLLLDAGADPAATTRDGYSALHLATKEESVEIVNALLERGAKSDQKTKKGFIPLHLAAKNGNLSIAQTLLEQAQTDPNATGRSGFSPVHVAAYYNQSPVLKLLAEHGGDINKPVKNGFTPLHLAAKRNNQACGEVLASQGANIDPGSRSGYTPLHVAAQDGQVEFVDMLVNTYKADPTIAAQDGLTPLHLAVQEDKVPVAECLLNAGAPLDASTVEAGFTPLHTAAYRGQLASVRLLLQRLAETGQTEAVNARTRMGSTPLHLASQQGHLQVVLKLLQSGADPNARNRQGWTAAQLAYKQHYLNLFEALQKVTTNVEDWSEPSLTGAGSDGLTDGDPNLVTGSISFEKVEHMVDHVVSDSDEEGGELIPTPSILRHRYKNRPAIEQQDDKWSRTSSYDLICQQLEYMKNHTDAMDETTIPSTPSLRVGPDLVRPGSLLISTRRASRKEDKPIRSSLHESITDERPRSYASDQVTMDTVVKQEATIPGATGSPTAISDWSLEADQMQLMRKPIKSGFLISFLVDARGCLVEAHRRADLRFYIPPNASLEPTRIICRVLRPEFAPNKPNMNDGDCLAARILEMAPYQAQFALPILIEVPHIASLRGREREIIVLRSETGNTWKEHQLDASDQAVHDALGNAFERVESDSVLRERHIHRILTYDFPQYFALLSRFRQEIALVGSEGGSITSTVCPQVQAVFPPGALQKKIKVGLQAQPIARELVTRIAGPRVSISPVVSIEPRRRKFHKPITLTIPLPRPPPKVEPGSTPNVRLLCSLSGGTNPAVWEDITGTTPLTRHKDCVSFTTTVSARLWLIDCPNSSTSAEIATRIYRESIVPPIIGRFAVYTRQPMSLDSTNLSTEQGETVSEIVTRLSQSTTELAQIRCLCLTDDNEDKTLECLERFGLVAVGQPAELLENRPYWIEMTGHLVPITKADSQPRLVVRPFQDNRLTFPVRLRSDTLEDETERDMATGTIHFMRDPRHLVREPEDVSPPQRPITSLELHLPRPGRSMFVVTADSEILGRSELDRIKLARQLGSDWERLARELQFTPSEIESIRQARNATGPMSEQEKAQLMLGLWQRKYADAGLTEKDALGNRLADALTAIHRSDVIHPSMTKIRPVWSGDEHAVASTILNGKGALPRVEEVSTERELAEQPKVDRLPPTVEQPAPIYAEFEKPTAVQDATTIETSFEEPTMSPTERDLSSISISEITKPIGVPEAIVSPAVGLVQPAASAEPIPEAKWQTDFLEQLDHEQLPSETISTVSPSAEQDIRATEPFVKPEAEADSQVSQFYTGESLIPTQEATPTVPSPEDLSRELGVRDMHAGYVIPDTVSAPIPTGPIVVPIQATAMSETGVPQLIQSKTEEDEIKEEQAVPIKEKLSTEMPTEAVPLDREQAWKASLLEHVQALGIHLEPIVASKTEELEPQVPDDQLQAVVHVRHPGMVSTAPAIESRMPDLEARLLIAQQLAESFGEESVVPEPAPKHTPDIVEEPIQPIFTDRRVVQIPTVVEAVSVPTVKSMEQVPDLVTEKVIETQFERETEALRPEAETPVLLGPVETTVEALGREALPPQLEPGVETEVQAVTTPEIGKIDLREQAVGITVPPMPIGELGEEEDLELPPVYSDEEGFEQVYHQAALLEQETHRPEPAIVDAITQPQPVDIAHEIAEKMEPIISAVPDEVARSIGIVFPPGSAGHDVVQHSPEESHEIRDIEEVLPDGTLVKSRTATAETVQSVSCRNWEEGVDAAIESGAYTVEEPEETTHVEEVEEVLPDGTVITRLVTTKHIIDRITEHAVSEETVQPELTEPSQLEQTRQAEQIEFEEPGWGI